MVSVLKLMIREIRWDSPVHRGALLLLADFMLIITLMGILSYAKEIRAFAWFGTKFSNNGASVKKVLQPSLTVSLNFDHMSLIQKLDLTGSQGNTFIPKFLHCGQFTLRASNISELFGRLKVESIDACDLWVIIRHFQISKDLHIQSKSQTLGSSLISLSKQYKKTHLSHLYLIRWRSVAQFWWW